MGRVRQQLARPYVPCTGWNAAQVSRFLGHSDAGFTLRTYVHLLDEDLPEPTVLDSLKRPENPDMDARAQVGVAEVA